MTLTSGTKLGPYEIQSPLGAGGMGEVYRARDTRLERTMEGRRTKGLLSLDHTVVGLPAGQYDADLTFVPNSC
jgi:serine/threonine protein kinase